MEFKVKQEATAVDEVETSSSSSSGSRALVVRPSSGALVPLPRPALKWEVDTFATQIVSVTGSNNMRSTLTDAQARLLVLEHATLRNLRDFEFSERKRRITLRHRGSTAMSVVHYRTGRIRVLAAQSERDCHNAAKDAIRRLRATGRWPDVPPSVRQTEIGSVMYILEPRRLLGKLGAGGGLRLAELAEHYGESAHFQAQLDKVFAGRQTPSSSSTARRKTTVRAARDESRLLVDYEPQLSPAARIYVDRCSPPLRATIFSNAKMLLYVDRESDMLQARADLVALLEPYFSPEWQVSVSRKDRLRADSIPCALPPGCGVWYAHWGPCPTTTGPDRRPTCPVAVATSLSTSLSLRDVAIAP